MKLLQLPNRKKIYVIDKLTAIDVYKEIFEENVYLREGLEVHPGATVIDIGGNIGLFSLFILEKVPNINLITIEPIPQNFTALQANVQNYRPVYSSVVLLNIGLAEKEKNVEFYFYPRVSADSTATPFDFQKQVEMYLAKENEGFARIVPKKVKTWIIEKFLRWMYTPVKVTCQLKTLSQVIADQKLDRIDFVKLDAENAEREVVMGINETDWKKIHQMSIEVHTNVPGCEFLVYDLTTLLESKGFSVISDLHSRFSDVGVHMMYARKKNL